MNRGIMNKRFQVRRNLKKQSLDTALQSVSSALECNFPFALNIFNNCKCDAPFFTGDGLIDEQLSFCSDKIVHVVDWNSIPQALHPSAGELSFKRAQRKKQQIESVFRIIQVEIQNMGFEKDLTLVDFGAGSGHLGLLIAFLYPQVRVILVERKEFLVNIARERIRTCDLNNASIEQRDVHDLEQSFSFDIAVGIHCCGLLTDAVLEKCKLHRASFVVVPCCYGQITRPPPSSESSQPKFKSAAIDIGSFVGFDEISLNSVASAADYEAF